MSYQPSKDSQRTVLVICMGMLLFYVFADLEWALYTALVVGLAGVSSQKIAVLIDSLWMRLGWLLGLMMPKIILGGVYFLLLTPLALLSRIVGPKDTLMLRARSGSMFITTQRKFDLAYFEKTW
jgi:hypothetical protein